MIIQSIFFKIYIMPMLIISPFITISCNSWFSIWMMMELNMMIFIPFIIINNKYYKELAMKYFIIQTISSATLILFSNSLFIYFYNFNFMTNLLINLSLLMKIGAAPMHLWFINLMKNMNWMNCLILSTWQKIIPMIILMYIFNKFLMYIIIILGTFFSAIFGLNHQSIRLILSYSSINNISWLIMNLMMSEIMWLTYFLSYSMINLSIIIILNKFNIYYINQMYNINYFNFNKLFLFLNFFSISSLPPMFGFLMKWMTLYYSIINNLFLLNIFMIIMSIITFIFYMRISMSMLMNFKIKHKLIIINKFNFFNKSLSFIFLTLFMMNIWIMSLWIM